MNNLLNGQKQFGLIDKVHSIWPVKSDSKKIRKLAYFADKEGKSRVIAIMDYWTQTALRPLHEKLNKLLKGIKTDCTFNQNHFLSVLSEGPFHSLDLTAATDRMPIDLQLRVMSKLIGEQKASAWKNLLVGEGFHSDAGMLFYNTGQPMGAYSS
jgi:hypothetical protein